MSFVNDPVSPLLKNARTIAVVGISEQPHRDSHRIARYLQQAGYTVYAVNPTLDQVLGLKAYPSLQALPEPVDIVDVFRRPEYVAEVVDDAIAAGAGALWLQFGVVDAVAAQRARDAGLKVVMDRCIKVDHASLV